MTLLEFCQKNKIEYLLDEWSSKNGDLLPDMVLVNSNIRVWWNSKLDGEIKAPIEMRLKEIEGFQDPKQGVGQSVIEKSPRNDLRGKTFGRLQVIAYEGVKKESMWRCRCECGAEIVVKRNNLVSGKTRSCGCLSKEVRESNFKKNIHFIDGTCVEKVAAKVTHQNNTSGFRGVSIRENGKYRAGMTFKGRRYELGTYDKLEDAIKARLAGETMIDEFVEKVKGQL